MWERGLKFTKSCLKITGICVAPLVGAWIEIDEYEQLFEEATVAPLVGAWIEIAVDVSGLLAPCGRSPCGSVD